MSTVVFTTLEEFLARPEREDDQREELIEGELSVSPGAKPSHAAIVRRLRLQLQSLEQRGYTLSNEFSCVLGTKSMPVPDLALVREDRWGKAVASDEWLYGSPELVIEVASPSNRKLHHKAVVYLDHGAEQVWIVYPASKTVAVITPDGTREARTVEAVEFHGVRVAVDSIFA